MRSYTSKIRRRVSAGKRAKDASRQGAEHRRLTRHRADCAPESQDVKTRRGTTVRAAVKAVAGSRVASAPGPADFAGGRQRPQAIAATHTLDRHFYFSILVPRHYPQIGRDLHSQRSQQHHLREPGARLRTCRAVVGPVPGPPRGGGGEPRDTGGQRSGRVR